MSMVHRYFLLQPLIVVSSYYRCSTVLSFRVGSKKMSLCLNYYYIHCFMEILFWLRLIVERHGNLSVFWFSSTRLCLLFYLKWNRCSRGTGLVVSSHWGGNTPHPLSPLLQVTKGRKVLRGVPRSNRVCLTTFLTITMSLICPYSSRPLPRGGWVVLTVHRESTTKPSMVWRRDFYY